MDFQKTPNLQRSENLKSNFSLLQFFKKRAKFFPTSKMVEIKRISCTNYGANQCNKVPTFFFDFTYLFLRGNKTRLKQIVLFILLHFAIIEKMMFLGWVGFQNSYVIFRVGHGKCLHLLTRWVGGVKKGQKTCLRHI